MLLTIELPDDVVAQLRNENAERSPLLKVETLAAWYLMFGMRQWQAYHEQVVEHPPAPPADQPPRSEN